MVNRELREEERARRFGGTVVVDGARRKGADVEVSRYENTQKKREKHVQTATRSTPTLKRTDTTRDRERDTNTVKL